MALAHVAASCSQPVPPHRPTRHTAAVGSRSWRPKPGCGSARASGMAACCCPALLTCGFGAGWADNGLQLPQPQLPAAIKPASPSHRGFQPLQVG